MADISLLQKEQFFCENKDIEVLMYQVNGEPFFNATKVWKGFGSPSKLEFSEYLRTDSARKLMIQMYSDLNGYDELLKEINSLTKGGFNPPFNLTSTLSENGQEFIGFSDVDSFLQATSQIRLKQFNPKFESNFVHTTKGRNGSTFLCYDLFLDYCTHLSTQLKLYVFKTFRKFGDLTKLEGKDLVDALQRKADEARANLPTFTSEVVSPMVRGEVKARTKALQRAIYDLYYTSHEKPKRNMYSHIHNQINSNLFGMTSENMQKLIALSETNTKTLIRDYMTEKAIRLLEAVEAKVYVFLVDCFKAKITPDLQKLNMVLSQACSSALDFAFLIKDDFHLLQNAIERDYDLLVKNADCVKDKGVIARPDEICAKTDLIPLTNASKS